MLSTLKQNGTLRMFDEVLQAQVGNSLADGRHGFYGAGVGGFLEGDVAGGVDHLAGLFDGFAWRKAGLRVLWLSSV